MTVPATFASFAVTGHGIQPVGSATRPRAERTFEEVAANAIGELDRLIVEDGDG